MPPVICSLQIRASGLRDALRLLPAFRRNGLPSSTRGPTADVLADFTQLPQLFWIAHPLRHSLHVTEPILRVHDSTCHDLVLPGRLPRLPVQPGAHHHGRGDTIGQGSSARTGQQCRINHQDRDRNQPQQERQHEPACQQRDTGTRIHADIDCRATQRALGGLPAAEAIAISLASSNSQVEYHPPDQEGRA